MSKENTTLQDCLRRVFSCFHMIRILSCAFILSRIKMSLVLQKPILKEKIQWWTYLICIFIYWDEDSKYPLCHLWAHACKQPKFFLNHHLERKEHNNCILKIFNINAAKNFFFWWKSYISIYRLVTFIQMWYVIL